MKTRKFSAILLWAVTILAVNGCTSATVTVSNTTRQPIRNVSLLANGQLIYQANQIPANSEGPYLKIPTPFPEQTVIAWTRDKGGISKLAVPCKEPLAIDFKGQLIYQVNRDGTVKLFKLRADKNSHDLIPWGFSQQFDGTVNIPGITPNQPQ